MLESVERLRGYVRRHTFRSGKTEGLDIEASPSRLVEMADAIEAEVEGGYVPLPLDADGVPVRVGDAVETMDGERFAVSSLEWGLHPSKGEGLFWVAWSADAEFDEDVRGLRHRREPTVADVLTEMVEKACGYGEAHTTVAQDAIAECAAKLRLAEGEDS